MLNGDFAIIRKKFRRRGNKGGNSKKRRGKNRFRANLTGPSRSGIWDVNERRKEGEW